MTRRMLILATVVMLAFGGTRTFAGKGGKPGGGNEPPPDPAIAMLDLNGSGPSDLVVMNEDGSNVARLLRGRDIEGAIGSPDWSPDGTRLVCHIGGVDGGSIHVLNADGTGLTQLRTRNGGGPTWVRWSPGAMPDGIERLAYTDHSVLADGTLGPEHLFLMETDGSNPIDTGRSGGHLSWSPDATRLAAMRRTNGIRVFHFGLDGAGDLVLTDAPRYDLGVDIMRVAWSKTQDQVLAVTVFVDHGHYEFWRIDLRDAVATGTNSDGTTLFTLTAHTVLFVSTIGWDCDWSSDDSVLIFRHGTTSKKPFTGCFLLDLVTPGAEPEPFYVGGWDPAWRR